MAKLPQKEEDTGGLLWRTPHTHPAFSPGRDTEPG